MKKAEAHNTILVKDLQLLDTKYFLRSFQKSLGIFKILFVCLFCFLSLNWLPKDQLWATINGAVTRTRSKSFNIITISNIRSLGTAQ